MIVDFFLKSFRDYGDRDAMIFEDKIYSYNNLLKIYADIENQLQIISNGQVVSLEADFSPASAMAVLALIKKKAIIVPIAESSKEKNEEFKLLGEIEISITVNGDNNITINDLCNSSSHRLYQDLRSKSAAGLVLFSSGSTGEPKGTVHNFSSILEKFKTKRRASRMISFLLFDHIGGLNTLFHSLANGGCVITVTDRNVDTVLSAIEEYKVEVLPTSPTFLNLILASQAYEKYDLSSLTLVTYGTELMNESVLKKISSVLPNVKFLQTYGLSEVGIMKTKSEGSGSLWLKVGGYGYETRVVDGLLEIKSKSTMLGYLNAASPFTEDGWFKTGDAVEQKGSYIKILGRKSEIINVGGQKVYPAEVEKVVIEIPEIKDVMVKGEANMLTGAIVVAKISLRDGIEMSISELRKKVQLFCKDKLEKYKIPKKIYLLKDELHSERFKKLRK